MDVELLLPLLEGQTLTVLPAPFQGFIYVFVLGGEECVNDF